MMLTAIKPMYWLNKRTLRVLSRLAAFYLLLCVAGCAWQRKLIYFPTKLDALEAQQLASSEGFDPWLNPAGEIIGWKLAATNPAIASVLIVHGNAGSALDRGYLARPIHDAAALDVYVLEYPGYGARPGKPSMKSLLAAGEEAFVALPTNQPAYVVSKSLGAGVAAHLARVHGRRVSGLMLIAPYNNLVSVGRRHMPFLPVKLILRERFDPAEWLRDYRGPVGVVIAGADEIIPPDLGHKLYEGYAGPKRLQVIEGAHHNEIAGQSVEWWQEVFSFWRENRK